MTMSDWLQRKQFVMHSGEPSGFKIECDNLTDEEIDTFAMLILNNMEEFYDVYGVPSGGTKIAETLKPYKHYTGKKFLLVDDVLTTGYSMEEARVHLVKQKVPFKDIMGVVLFARTKAPEWITPVFQMWG